jgi:hypothetical protein
MQSSRLVVFCFILSFFSILPAVAYPDDPFITIDPSGNHSIGDVFFINGTTNLPANDTIINMSVTGRMPRVLLLLLCRNPLFK